MFAYSKLSLKNVCIPLLLVCSLLKKNSIKQIVKKKKEKKRKNGT